jgi:hypothetical protein
MLLPCVLRSENDPTTSGTGTCLIDSLIQSQLFPVVENIGASGQRRRRPIHPKPSCKIRQAGWLPTSRNLANDHWVPGKVGAAADRTSNFGVSQLRRWVCRRYCTSEKLPPLVIARVGMALLWLRRLSSTTITMLIMKKGIPNANGHDNDHVDVEIVAPLTRSKMIQQQSRSSSFGESLGQILFYDDPIGDEYDYDYDDDQNDDRRRRRLSPCRRDVRELAVAVLIFGLGWYGPQCILLPYYFAALLDNQNIPPFQTTKAGDVLLDFMLNQPLVEPPTIPGTCAVCFFVS